MATYRRAFNAAVSAGEIRPVVFPYFGFGLFVLIAYLCIPHVNRPWVYAARWPVLAVIVLFESKIMRETKTMSMATGFGSGLVATWGIVWSWTWLVWRAPQWDAKRVERRKISGTRADEGAVNGDAVSFGNGQTSKSDENLSNGYAPKPNGSVTNGHALKSKGSVSNGHASKTNGTVKQRHAQNGHAKTGELEMELKQSGEYTGDEYYWQSYPMDSLRARINWVIDLVLNVRGPGWNWEVPTNPGLPPHVKLGLGEPIDLKSMRDTSSTGIKRYNSRSELFRYSFPRFIVGYLILDALKVVLMKDPYFLLGPNNYPPPAYLSSLSPVTLIAYRELLSLIAIITALETIFQLAPLGLCLILGPRVFDLRGEAWMYPTTWGMLDTILSKGLNGLWGGWWHQTFRFAFSAPTHFLIKHSIIKPKSPEAKLIGLVVAFGISGLLHAGGSITQFPTTQPWNPPLFFMLQAVGVLLQTYFCIYFKKWIVRLPAQTRQAGNFAFTFTWLYCTAPILIDDFARGGIWLFEPVPVSPLRGLGFGDKADGWWCWGDIGVGWYRGRHWWESGLAF